MNAKKKTGLGRGLSALLEGANDPQAAGQNKDENSLVWSQGFISLDSIEANPFQPRTVFESEALEELCQSIKEQGIIQPITVRKSGHNSYQLISGERRLKAAGMAGLKEIPAFIRTANDNQMLELALVENIQRKDLNCIDVAISFQRLVEEYEYSQEVLADKVGKKRSTVTNYLRLLKLPPEVQVALRDDHISMGHARALINLEDTDTQLAILKNILSKGLSVRDVEKIVQDLAKPLEKKKTATQPLPQAIKQMKDHLENHLGGKVNIQINKKGKGSIQIPFQSDRQLESILQTLADLS